MNTGRGEAPLTRRSTSIDRQPPWLKLGGADVVVQIIIYIVALFKLVFCCFSNCFKLHLPLVYICEHISLLSLAYKRGGHRSLYQEENKQHKRGSWTDARQESGRSPRVACWQSC